jgi:acyl-CoA ligase (AMP-forming) (exosortase A-associated)
MMPYLVHQMLQDSARKSPHQEAFTDSDGRILYAQAAEIAKALGNTLRTLGIKRGDRVGVQLPPTSQLPLSLLGISFADAVFVPIHHGLFPEQVTHILKDSKAAAFICDPGRLHSLEPHQNDLEDLQFALVDDRAGDQELPKLPTIDTYRLRESLTSQSASHATCTSLGKDLAAILYTSGSTGRPKGVMLSHENIIAGAEIVSEYLSIGKSDRILAALPLSFDAGLNQVTTAILKGATTIMISFRFGREIVRTLIDEEITGLAGVPSLWNLLTRPSSGLGKQSLPSLRYITNTGGAMPQGVLSKLRHELPDTDVVLMYGLTEAFRSTYLPPEKIDQKPTSMGKPIPRTDIFIINEQGKICETDEVGELVHDGPTVSMGYWGHPELTAKVLRPHPLQDGTTATSGPVCYSGDLVRKDAEGYFYFVGRRDNQIKSSGFRISPTEVEDAIAKMPSISQSAVVGAPDEVLGQHLVAFIIPTENADLKSSDVMGHCANLLPRHMVPKRVEIVESLPQTSSGKVNYPALRKTLLQHTSPTSGGES